jgi:dTDP-4-amino-4,6-dideoxygalactose transaminase
VPASLPIAESLAERCFSLPVYPELTDAMVDRICAVIRDAVGG